VKIFGHHVYLLISRIKLPKEKRESLCVGLSHIHENPLRKPLLRIIRAVDRKTVVDTARTDAGSGI